MPSSHFSGLNEISQLIILTDPESILDVGVGFGKYGVLSREYLELWDGRERYDDWKRRIDGVEAFESYITPLHEYIYDHIYIGDALSIISGLSSGYDLILLIDVLEHFDHKDGMALLNDCMKIGRNILISTPRDIGNQKDAFGNPYETHKFQWTKKHFGDLEHKIFLTTERSLICYAGEKAPVMRKKLLGFSNRVKRLLKAFD